MMQPSSSGFLAVGHCPTASLKKEALHPFLLKRPDAKHVLFFTWPIFELRNLITADGKYIMYNTYSTPLT